MADTGKISVNGEFDLVPTQENAPPAPTIEEMLAAVRRSALPPSPQPDPKPEPVA